MNDTIATTIIDLVVDNHPGVMSHITGLFSRRGYNLEGIVCGPVAETTTSRMFLLVVDDERREQIVRQLEKLYDVRSVTVREDGDHSLFHRLHEFVLPDKP